LARCAIAVQQICVGVDLTAFFRAVVEAGLHPSDISRKPLSSRSEIGPTCRAKESRRFSRVRSRVPSACAALARLRP
jgi:hypothetical protein